MRVLWVTSEKIISPVTTDNTWASPSTSDFTQSPGTNSQISGWKNSREPWALVFQASSQSCKYTVLSWKSCQIELYHLLLNQYIVKDFLDYFPANHPPEGHRKCKLNISSTQRRNILGCFFFPTFIYENLPKDSRV